MPEVIQQTQEWHDLRSTKIGASDASIIMGVSPWTTPYQLWEQKLRIAPPKEKTAAMQRGLDVEEEARQAFERETGFVVFPKVVISENFDWMMASLDGITLEGDKIVEIKCAGHADHECALSGKIPEKYYPQLQHQMYVTKLDMAYYYSYNAASSAIVEVQKDDSYIETMLEAEKKFYECMIEFVAPTLTDRDFINLDNNKEWREFADSYRRVKKLLKDMEVEEKKLREKMISMAGGRNVQGNGIKLQKIISQGRIDYSAIPEIINIDLNKYRKEPVKSWRIQC